MSLLAVGISFRRKRDYALQNERAADAARITSRIDSLPVSIDAKAQICATAASSKYAYGLEFGPASLEALAPLTVAVKKAIWNRSLKFPLEELLHTLPFKGWSIHPHMQWVAQTLMRVRRILAQYAELRPPFAEVWEAFSQTNEVMYCTRFGLIATVARVVQDVGWQWPEPFTIVTDWGMRIDFLSVDPGFWEHEVRRATRRMMWQTLSTRLPKYLDVQGLPMPRGVATECVIEHTDTFMHPPGHGGEWIVTLSGDVVHTLIFGRKSGTDSRQFYDSSSLQRIPGNGYSFNHYLMAMSLHSDGMRSSTLHNMFLTLSKMLSPASEMMYEHNEAGPASGKHFLDPTYRHNEQQHCLICRAAYKVGTGVRSLKDPCPRAGEAGFAETWSQVKEQQRQRASAAQCPPN
ncbi:hypothetical protein AK812_SmicGene31158 [Symbiodinium microadriaticum]|uniref:Uncharacterized protein n=1 Tax=Symbiodinium microadriaticum TaxID=2951 RepID=A0A1Q9CXF2_SYMMI|nr:hypothetical protein AK812_SmicGene31158 [Symbiodinium microadriaticum]CAE7370870.1 unnamed protein product [Symbiodinium microadriaticum]CAE7493682.1 unnamed protein product [Symbiodinium sp. KB8]